MTQRGSSLLTSAADAILALVVLAVTAPLLLVISLILKSGAVVGGSSGRVLVSDRRLGFARKPFGLLRFCVFRDGGALAEQDAARRFTRLGWLLRKTRIEDLPQFINLLKGDVTLIGPCPDNPAYADLGDREIRDYAQRFEVKPGMTGWAQVHGIRDELRGSADDVADILQVRADYDRYYLVHQSLGLDTRIFGRTALSLLLLRPLGEEGKIQRVYRMFQSSVMVADEKGREKVLQELETCNKPTILSFLNAHGFNVAWSEENFLEALSQSDMILRDGVGMKAALRLFGQDAGLNMNGTDLIPEILERQKDRRVAVLGTRDPWLSQAVDRLKAQGVNVVWSDHGFHPTDYYAAAAQTHKPDLVVLAMGMPKQEYVAVALKEGISGPCLIVNGGAVIDFIGERVQRAPEAFRASGLEWLYRLTREPKRLFCRYILGNPVFLMRVVLMRARLGFVGFRKSVLGPVEGSSGPRVENI